MEKEKIYIFTDTFPYGTGEKSFILPEIEALKNVYEIVIISGAPTKIVAQKESISKLDDDIKVFCFNAKENSRISYYVFFLLFWIKKDCRTEVKNILVTHKKVLLRIWKSMHFYARAECLYHWIRKNNIINQEKGIYYSYWYNDKVLAMTLHRDKYPKLKVIARAHGYDLFDERMETTLRQPFKEVMDLSLDKLIFASKYGYQYYLGRMKKSPCSKYTIYKIGAMQRQKIPTYDNNRFFRIVSCSNLIPLKRVSLIIDSLSQIRDINIEWIHFGDGEDRCYVEKYAKEKLEKMNNIKYQLKGYASNDKIHEFYSGNYVNCFITLSSSEGGCPVSIQEAMAYGIPIIGTDVGGISEMISGNGYLLSADPTVCEVSDKIRAMEKLDESMYANMRNTSLRIWEKDYNKNENVKKFMTFLLSI